MIRNNEDSMIRDASDKNIQNFSLESKRGHYQQQMKGGQDNSWDKNPGVVAESSRVRERNHKRPEKWKKTKFT